MNEGKIEKKSGSVPEAPKKELSVEEIITRYKKIGRSRQKYAIKRFFKIKRGAIGFAILVILTLLSVLSPIVAPNPDKQVHAELSKPAWLAIFDRNYIGDSNPINYDFSPTFDLAREVSSGSILITQTKSMSAKSFYLESTAVDGTDGYFDMGCLAISIVDNRSSKNPHLVGDMYDVWLNFIFRWDKNKIPYKVYYDFARKVIVDVPPLENGSAQYTLAPNGEASTLIRLPAVDLKVNMLLTVRSEGRVLVTVKNVSANYSEIINTTVDGIETFSFDTYTSTESTPIDYRIYIKNLEDRSVGVSLEMKPNIAKSYNMHIALYANLYNSTAKRPFTEDELARYLEENNVVVPYLKAGGIEDIDEQKQARYLSNWADEAARKSPDEISTKKFLTDLTIPVFFRKGNYIVMTIKIQIGFSRTLGFSEYLLKQYLKDNIKIRVLLDDILLQVQDEYYGLMGTDGFKKDIFALIVDGLKISLLVGFIATAANLVVGVSLGLVSGYMGGKIDEVIMRIVDFMLSIPTLPLLLVLSFIFLEMNMDPLFAIILVLSIFGWSGMARTIRSQVLALKANVYVEAARASGASTWYIVRKHILPGVWPLVLIYLMQGVVANILAEAGLSFLGVLRPNWNSLGKMIQEASGVSATQVGGGGGIKGWHWVFFPGLVLMLIGYAFYAIADAYDEVINPRRRRF